MTPHHRAAIKTKAINMVQHFIDGYQIRGIGSVFAFKHGAPDSGKGLMSLTDAAQCRDYLSSVGIRMFRVDSGGSPEWHFSAAFEEALHWNSLSST